MIEIACEMGFVQVKDYDLDKIIFEDELLLQAIHHYVTEGNVMVYDDSRVALLNLNTKER